MMLSKTILAAAFVAASFSQAAVAATIVNGSFEQGTVSGAFTTLGTGSSGLPGWNIAGSIDHIGSYWQASQGAKSLDMSGTGAGSISQIVSGLVVGQLYQIMFDLSGNPDGGLRSQKKLQVSMSPSTGTAFTYTYSTTGTRSNMNWVTKVFSFVATSKSALLTFASKTTTPYGPALDNVHFLAAVPVPAGAPLLLGGIAALGALRRRRRAV